jgi:GT2 family glycosyltransferase
LKSLLHRFISVIPKRWRQRFSSISILKLLYDFIMSGYSPKVSYKNLLSKQYKLLVANNKQLDLCNKKKLKLTVIIELSCDYKYSLKSCLDSLILLSNDIDNIYFLYDVAGNKENQKELENDELNSIEKTLTALLTNFSLTYTTDSKVNFINNMVNINTEAFVWCQTPVVFYSYSFETLLQCYNADVKTPSAIYSDHDLLCNGDRLSPAFKPALNIDWLLCSNYMGKVILFNKVQLLDKLESLILPLCDEKSDIMYEWLKVIASDTLCSIKHVPFVLYSEHNVEQVTATTTSHIKRINWPLPKDIPLVSIIIPTRNGKQLVQQCIESLYRFTHYNNFEVLLVDNGSDEVESIVYFKKLDLDNKVNLLHYNAAFNYSAINNFAVQYAKGDVLLFMNNDIELLHEKWLDEMVMQVMREEIGCVGAKLYYPNMTIQHAGIIVGLWGCAGHSHKHFKHTDSGYMNRLNVVQNYSAVTAACMAVRKQVFNEVKGFNEEDLAVAFNDVDICLKIQAKGYRNLWTPYAEMIHHESSSRGSEDTPEKKVREAKEIAYMQSKWHLNIKVDPAYSSWLTQEKEDFSFIIESRQQVC